MQLHPAIYIQLHKQRTCSQHCEGMTNLGNWSYSHEKLELDEETRELLMINTHCGLYESICLEFGVYRTTRIFQKEMKNQWRTSLFQKIQVYDRLVSGKDDSSHLMNLQKKLTPLDKDRLKLKQCKCWFVLLEVILLYRHKKIKEWHFLYKNITLFILFEVKASIGVRETDRQKETNRDCHIDP